MLALTNLAAYFDGEHFTDAGAGKVSSWTDRSPNGRHATQATGAKQPTMVSNVLNGLAVCRFAGGQCLQTAAFALTTFDIFFTIRGVTSASAFLYEHSADANSNNGSYLKCDLTNTIVVKRGANLSSKDQTASWPVSQEAQLVCHHFGEGTHADHRILLWGSMNTPNTSVGASNPGTGSTGNQVFNIGARNNAASLQLTGDIANCAIFSPANTPQVRRQLMNYFGALYATDPG